MKTTLGRSENGDRRRDRAAVKCVILPAVLACCLAVAARAQNQPSPILTDTLLEQAAPDECFAGIGQPYPAMLSPGVCPSGSVPKTNQVYVWGLTGSLAKLWFGTAANVLCLTPGSQQNPTPYQTPVSVCEYGQSQYGIAHGLPPNFGDWRPPKAFVYDTGTNTLTDVTPTDSKFPRTLGIRSAGAMGDTIFLAGPALGKKGVNFFAWSSSTQQYLGSCQASSFNNIRQWSLINNVLYAGVGNFTGGGSIIRWNGTPQQPFDTTSSTCGFEIVAHLHGEAAYLTAFGPNSDQIAVSAWPNPNGAGVYLSPVMNTTTGLTSRDASTPWTQVWAPSMYEPDPVTATAYAGGALAYWNGALYFGTMNLVKGGLIAWEKVNGTPTGQQYVQVFQNTYRAISIWAIQNPSTTPTVQLLYGESVLPKYDSSTKTFVSTPTGFTPLYGPSGFGNIYNCHTWSATVFQNHLFFGMMDWSYLQHLDGSPPPAPGVIQPSSGWGADLWRFDGPGPAVAENINGLGNFLNVGFRTMLVSPDGQNLFLGTANQANLSPMAGWQLWDLKLAP